MKVSRTGNILSSQSFIRFLKITISILSLAAVSFIALPLSHLKVRVQQGKNLTQLDESLLSINNLLLKVLLETYTIQEFSSLNEAFDLFLKQYSKTEESLSGHSNIEELTKIHNYLVPQLEKTIEMLREIEANRVQAGYMPLVERKYANRLSGIPGSDSLPEYLLINNTTDLLQLLILAVIPEYRQTLKTLSNHIEELKLVSIKQINAVIIMILVILFLSALLMSSVKLRKRRLSEEMAIERSEQLEILVKARTADLEKQNQQLSEAQDMLVEREKMAALGEVVSGVAHEVNTPLGICVTAVSFLGEKLNENQEKNLDREELKEINRIITSNLNRALKLVQGFKKVAVDESGDEIRSFDLISYLKDDLLPSIAPMIRKNGHTVSINAPKSCMMNSSPGAIAQIVINLVMNASIHGYEDIKSGIIYIDIENSGPEVHISIRDKGRGMSAETKSHIYEPFFTTKKDLGGSGLGLMIVYSLVHNKLKGSLVCRTAPGKGTEFAMVIPVDIESLKNEETAL